MFQVRRADTDLDRSKVLAHRRYVLGERAEGELEPDPADAPARLWAAWRGNAVAGSVRVNHLADGSAGPLEAVFGLDQLAPIDRAGITVTSRPTIPRADWSSPMAVRLAQAAYRASVAEGVRVDYLAAPPGLAPAYARLGYESIGEPVEVPGLGPIQPLRLALDPGPLRRARSPLVLGLPRRLDPRPGLGEIS